MSITDVDFVAWDNSDPPQLWAWSGEYGDESSEPLFRLPAAELRTEWDAMRDEITRWQNLWQTAVDAEGTNWAEDIVRALEAAKAREGGADG